MLLKKLHFLMIIYQLKKTVMWHLNKMLHEMINLKISDDWYGQTDTNIHFKINIKPKPILFSEF